MIDLDSVPSSFWSQLNLKFLNSNDRGNFMPNLWCFCDINLSPAIISRSSQQLSVSFNIDDQDVFISGVYASTSYLLRRHLWSDLSALQNSFSGPWCILGDFNSVLGAHETRGSNLPLQVAFEDFK